MVPQKNHLPYEELRKHGYKEVATPYFLAKARPNNLLKNRFSVIIGSSVIKNATQRNFLRRQAKSAFLTVPQKGFDLFVILRSRAAFASKHIFQETLNKSITSLITHP